MLSDSSPTNGAAALSTAPPDLDTEAAAAVARELFGVTAQARLLTSERDLNVHLAGEDGAVWLLKISNPSDPADLLDFQTDALDHIARTRPSCPVPRVMRTLDGRDAGEIALNDGRRSQVRLLTYLEGVPVRDTPRTTAQRVALGTALAELDLALADFTHPAASHDLMWNASQVDRLTDMIDEVATGEKAALLRHFIDRFVTVVKPRLPTLRAQVIHNDYHLFNTLVATEDATRVTGIIDFGDMIHAPLVTEVATGAAYQLRGADDPLGAVAEFVAAYHAVVPLDAAEQEVVADLMAARHVVTALITGWRVIRYPENKAYILRHNPEAWDALTLMADLGPATVRDRVLSLITTGASA